MTVFPPARFTDGNQGSPNGLGAGYFLLQHKRQLGGAKFIWKIKIFKVDDFDAEDPNIIFYVDPNVAPVPLEEDSLAESEIWKRNTARTELLRRHVIKAKL